MDENYANKYFYTTLLSTLCKGHHVYKGNFISILASKHMILNGIWSFKHVV